MTSLTLLSWAPSLALALAGQTAPSVSSADSVNVVLVERQARGFRVESYFRPTSVETPTPTLTRGEPASHAFAPVQDGAAGKPQSHVSTSFDAYDFDDNAAQTGG